MNLQDCIHHYYPLNDEEALRLSLIFKERWLLAGEVLVSAGNIESKLWMIGQGHMRSYFKRANKEITLYFGFPGDVVGGISSLLTGRTGFEIIEATEKVLVYEADFMDLIQLRNERKEIQEFYIRLLEFNYVYWETQLVRSRFLSVTERYLLLLKDHPNIFQLFPQYQIASLLGTTPETLSRIRAGKYLNE